jgi:hypothetical protein
VGRKSKGNWCERIFEDNALLGDDIDIRGDFTGITVATQIICPTGIDTDEDNTANLSW